MAATAAQVLRQYLIDVGVFVGPNNPPAGSWPAVVGAVPSGPKVSDNYAGLTRTGERQWGRSTTDGRRIQAPLVQIMVRSVDSPTGESKCQEIQATVDKIGVSYPTGVGWVPVNVGTENFVIRNVHTTAAAVPLGQEQEGTRYLFAINFQLDLVAVDPADPARSYPSASPTTADTLLGYHGGNLSLFSIPAVLALGGVDTSTFALKATTVTGTGNLTGGGDLSANRTISLVASPSVTSLLTPLVQAPTGQLLTLSGAEAPDLSTAGGQVSLRGGRSTALAGGDIFLRGGDSSGSLPGGNVSVRGGSGSTTGTVTISGSAVFTTGGNMVTPGAVTAAGITANQPAIGSVGFTLNRIAGGTADVLQAINSDGTSKMLGLSSTNVLRVYEAAGTKNVAISHDGTTGAITNSSGGLSITTGVGNLDLIANGVTFIRGQGVGAVLRFGAGIVLDGVSTVIRGDMNALYGFNSAANAGSASNDTQMGRESAGIMGFYGASKSTRGAIVCGQPAIGTIGLTINRISSGTANYLSCVDSDGSTTRFCVDSTGGITARSNNGVTIGDNSGNTTFVANNSLGVRIGDSFTFCNVSNTAFNITGSAIAAVAVAANFCFAFSNANNAPFNAKDTSLYRSAAGVVAVGTGGTSGHGAFTCGQPTTTTVGLTVNQVPSSNADYARFVASDGVTVHANLDKIGTFTAKALAGNAGRTDSLSPLSDLETAPLRCTCLHNVDGTDYYPIPTAGNELTVFTASGVGVVAMFQTSLSSGAFLQEGHLRIYVDGETVPSFDVELGTLFLTNLEARDLPGDVYTTPHWQSSFTGNGAQECTFALRFPIPFGNGIRIAFANPAGTVGAGQNAIFTQTWWRPGVVSKWRLRSAGRPYKGDPIRIFAALNSTYQYLKFPAASGLLVGLFQTAKALFSTTFGYLEKNWYVAVGAEVGTVTYDAQGNPVGPALITNGTEDTLGLTGWYGMNLPKWKSAFGAMTNGNNTSAWSFCAGIDWLACWGGIPYSGGLEIGKGSAPSGGETSSFVILYYSDTSVTQVASAPRVTTTNSNTGVVLAFDTQTMDQGSSPVTGYSVAVSPAPTGGSPVVVGTGATVTITGLTAGTTYTFTATAVNAVGNGAAAAPVDMTWVASASLVWDDYGTDADDTDLFAHYARGTLAKQFWVVVNGAIGTTGGRAVPQTGVLNLYTVDAGTADVQINVQLRFTAGSPALGVAFRVQDLNNHWKVDADKTSGALILYEIVGGGATNRGSWANVFDFRAGGYALEVTAKAGVITVKVDGVVRITYNTATTFLAVTKHGIANYGPFGLACSWDNFLISAAP